MAPNPPNPPTGHRPLRATGPSLRVIAATSAVGLAISLVLLALGGGWTAALAAVLSAIVLADTIRARKDRT